MPTDYKHMKTGGYHEKKQKHIKKAPPPLLTFLMGFILGGLITALSSYLLFATPKLKSTQETQVTQPAQTQKNSRSHLSEKLKLELEETNATSVAPTFDFYQILPNKKTRVAKQQTENIKMTKMDAAYILQLGSFTHLDSAKKLQTSAQKLGITAHIQQIVINDKYTHHRVRLGPFDDIQTLISTRKKLAKHNIEYILLELEDMNHSNSTNVQHEQ